MNSLTNRSICFACHVLVACIGTFSLPAQYFTDITPAAFGTNIFNPEWADYDNDNDLDLYLAGSIYRNDGNLTFVKVAELAEGAPHGVAWGDYDRDGDLDLAIAGDGFARIYRNDGGDVFTDINAGLTGVPGPSLAWGDYDNNGRLDLLLSGDYSTVLYHNNGDSTFTVAAGTGLPAVAGPFVWGDYDNDGWLDLLGGVPPEVYHNNHDGTFRPAGAGLLNLGGRSAAWGDYDNDGDLDVLLTGPSFPSYILKAYRNNGDGTFIDLNLTLQGTAFGDAHWVDFNNDGFSDIFVSGCSVSYCDASIAGLYRNNGLGSFVDANVGLSLARYAPSMAAWGDFDGDGDLDLLLDHLYRNNCGTSNSPPTAPSELAAEILPDNDVLLRWTRATDAETTNTLGLNYAVRIGTVPGGFDYLSPAADPVTGFRRLPERGPHQTNACWLRDVPHGTYYWSVQAIDPTLAGSRFAVESAFTVPNARPFISAVSNQVTVPGRTTPAIPFSISDVETPAGELLLSASISDTTLVPAGNVVFGGASSNRTVTLSPALGKSGTASISIAVQDSGGLTATSRFDLVVQTFTDAAAGLPAIPIGASASGDYDNDGLLDIALGGGVSDYTTIYRNRGGVFSNAISSLPNRYKNDLAWVDYNHDGYLDLTECGWDRNGYGPRVYLFQNNATNSFTALTLPGITNVADGSLAWGDYDNDGDEDLLLTGDPDTYHSSNGATKLYRSDKGVFVDSGLTFPGVCKSAAVWLDFDRDGDPDILFAGQTGSSAATGTSRLFRNDGNGSFTEAPSSLPGVSQCALAVADYDRDGYPDLVLAGLGTNSVPLTRIYRNVLLGAFTEVPTALPGVSSGCAAWGDFDNDGFPDLVITGTTNGFSSGAITRVYHNNAGASFTDLGGALPGVSGKAAAWGDYDNDGDLDLLLGARVFRNNFNAPNAPPSPPTALASTILRDGVRLSWATSTDAESMNPTMLTYNLRVGTEPGGIQIVAPQSDLDSGFRRVPQPGNCGNLNSWRFLNLAKGTYYWSVQAVDSVFAGSPFAAEGVSVVTNFPPPVAQSQSITTAEDQPREILLSGIAIDGDPLSFLVVDWPSFGRLTGIAPSLVYWPLTNYFGPDQFSFRVYDSQTNSLPATVFVTVTPLPDVVGPTLAIGHLQNAAVQLSLQLEPWQTYELQASEDLFSWFPLTNVLSTNSFLPWVDADYTNFNRRFYRLVSPR